ncbi:Acyl carrier protein [Candidatus Regiella insecticola 5.15]|uniref:Acyl carrier protein n=1 Tax=Candidatus Regiella insecticola 5.15 TaxID=1005043 RepID=G2GWE7_9ENTR|nr:phosphopantetheine-binding protein [Candidatus Regiella insecticola]EGY29939.1 Acyl carrier protein [Candidatus Regiella insecticola 5.15]
MMKNSGKTDHKRITRQILVTCLGCSEQDLSDEKHLINDLYADSLALIDMVIMISEQLKIDMDEKDIININTVNDLYCWVENKILAVSSDFA